MEDHFDYTPNPGDPLKAQTRCNYCGTVKPDYQGDTFAGYLSALGRWTQRHVRECPSGPENTMTRTP